MSSSGLREYTISPTPDGTKKDRTRFLGKYRQKNKLHEYYEPHYSYKDVDLDGELISDLAEDLTADRKSRDGISADLFPLTAAKQKRYQFRLEGTEEYKGRNVYRITFQPVNNTWKDDGPPWAGEALIDIDQHQPVLITTKLARGLPVWVKIVLGTSLKYVGFKMTYKEFDDGIWFPVSYGGEFEVRAVFFYKRKISLSLRNSGFQRADVNSTVTYLDPVQ